MMKHESLKRSFAFLSAATLLCVALSGCVAQPSVTEIKKPEPTPTPYEEPSAGTPAAAPSLPSDEAYSVWIPYWDYADAILEVDACSELVRDVIPFAVIMDSSGKPYLLEEMEQATAQVIKAFGESKNIFLSFTNDVMQADDSIVQKDIDILCRILKSDAAIDENIDQLLATCAEYNVDGIEIDYENLDKFDEDLLAQYLLFIERLYARTEEAGLRLRVVVGVYPVTYTAFPKGPEYVVMCYNLFGLHSGPGPKANKAFLSSAYASNQALPGKVSMAFATGGFDWISDGSIVGLTEVEALQLAQDAQIPADDILRDEESSVCRFTFTDSEGLFHEVWFADGQTLLTWMDLAREFSYESFAIWRLGGNVNSELTTITQHR